MRKLRLYLSLALVVVFSASAFCGCRPSFEERCVTTEDGYVYFEHDAYGLCLIAIPEVEELVLPEYIDGKRVEMIGCPRLKDGTDPYPHQLDGRSVKKLTIRHKVKWFYANFMDLETITYVSPIDCCFVRNERIMIPYGARFQSGEITLLPYDGEREDRDTGEVEGLKEIYIMTQVTKIAAGTFDGLEGVTIKVEHESKPEGYEDGWNGDCQVLWGEEIQYVNYRGEWGGDFFVT